MTTPPTTTPNQEAPKSLSRTLDSSLQPAGQRDRAHAGRDPEWVGGVGSVGGPGFPAPPRSLRSRSRAQGLLPGDHRSRARSGPAQTSGERRRAGAGLTVRSSWVRSFMLPGVAAAPAAA